MGDGALPVHRRGVHMPFGVAGAPGRSLQPAGERQDMRAITALAATAALSGTALAQTLQFDINDAEFQVYDAQGNAGAFGGVNHTGSIQFLFDAPYTIINAVSIQAVAGGSFVEQLGFTGTLTDFMLDFQLVNGVVTGGSVAIEVDGGADTYGAVLLNGMGNIEAQARGFSIDSLSQEGAFSDANLGNVDVSAWFNAQGASGDLFGDVFSFKFTPDSGGHGWADVEVYTTVPAPGAAGVLGLAGVAATRRRRA